MGKHSDPGCVLHQAAVIVILFGLFAALAMVGGIERTNRVFEYGQELRQMREQ